jgi:fructokinase
MARAVLSFGETLWDLLPAGAVLGGAPANFAYRLNALGDRALLVTRLGRDDLGRRAFAQLEALGMPTSGVQWDEARPTGTVRVTLDARGVPDFTILPDAAYDAIEPTDALLEAAEQAEAICFGTLIQRSERSRRTLHALLDRAPRAVKLLDLNLRKGCWSPRTVADSLARADLLKLNDTEVATLRDLFGLRGKTLPAQVREIRRRWSLSACVATLGERGAFVAARRGEAHVAGTRVRVVDTVGAGDAFTAGFLHAWLRGRSPAECAGLGNALGARVAAQPGATTPIPTDELAALTSMP